MAERERPNLVLTGFMATGKTTVGQRVAESLGMPFVDLDAWIEARLGERISQVFATRGEPFFREVEAQIVLECSSLRGTVIATGGGAVLRPDNRAWLERAGVIVRLTARPEVLARRAARSSDRPLLTGDGASAESVVLERMRALLDAREPIYAALPHHIDTSDLEVAEVVEQVVALFERETRLALRPHAEAEGPSRHLGVDRAQHLAGAERGPAGTLESLQRIPVPLTTGGYTVVFGPGALDHAGELLAELEGIGRRVAVVSSEPVRSLLARRVVASLEAAGFEVAVIPVPDGEAAKNAAELQRLWTALHAAGLNRSSAVIALGGGAVGDLAGFAAATYMRGIALVQAPTTLLAQVDASIGGKVAIDHNGVKNLVGAFAQPRLVITDPEALATLPERERRSGLAEVIKHAAIDSEALFARLERELAAAPMPAPEAIADNLRVKIGIVARDPEERGERVHLNFGHTFGHAIEAVSGYRLPHGYAVAIGMVAAARTAERAGVAAPGLAARLSRLIEHVGLPSACPDLGLDPIAVRAAMNSDKKTQDNRLRLVLLRAIGQPFVTEDIPEPLIRQAIAEMVAPSQSGGEDSRRSTTR